MSTTHAEQRELRGKVMAAMETGQHGMARTVLTELAEYDSEYAETLRKDALISYGVRL